VRIYGAEKTSITARDLIEYIDWSPFFHAWELRGRYPAIFDDPKVGKQARELFDDAQELLERIAAKKSSGSARRLRFLAGKRPSATMSMFTPMTRARKRSPRSIFWRQQMQKPDGQFNHCLADYVAPVDRDKGRRCRIILADLQSPFMVRMRLRRSSSVSTTTTTRL
jgi:5-methyltetrahydrofolate--homocysteine methyltransferase